MKTKISFLLAICLLVCTACEKDKFSPPSIQTVSISAQSPTTVTFVGNISSLGSEKIKDYGFIYNNSPVVNEQNGIKVSLGNSPQQGEYAKRVDNLNFSGGSYYNNTVWVRAYLEDTKGTAFGDMKNVVLPNPSASSIVPSSGMSGDVVKIAGQFYEATVDNMLVAFNSIQARVISVNRLEVAVEVPSGINVRHGSNISVNVSIGGVPSNNGLSFRILANIKDFLPKSGPVGTVVTFTGDNMPDYYSSSDISIQFGNASFSSIYNNRMNVPFTVNEMSEVSVTVGGKRKILGTFAATPPQITSTNVQTVLPGQNILVNGNNFPTVNDASAGQPMIKLGNGGYVAVSRNTANQFVYTVPLGTAEGEYTLYLKIGPHEVSAPQKINVMGYNATSFAPSSGGPGREVNITGVFVQGSNYYVSFGTSRVYGTATSPTNLRVFVPSGIQVGQVSVSVEVPGRTIVIPGVFEVEGPSFTSFSPASGVPGTLITIKGTGFNPSIHNTSVRFGTVSVAPVSVTYDTIVVAVPSNVAPGAMKLTVVTYGQSVTHSDNFTILN